MERRRLGWGLFQKWLEWLVVDRGEDWVWDRGLGSSLGLSPWCSYTLYCLSFPAFPRPQPEPGVAMATSEEPISLVMSGRVWTGALGAAGKRPLLLSPISLQTSSSSQRPFLRDSAAPPPE